MFGQAIVVRPPFLLLWWWKRPLFFISTPKHPFYSKMMLTTYIQILVLSGVPENSMKEIEGREYTL